MCRLGKAKPISSQSMHSSGILQVSYFRKKEILETINVHMSNIMTYIFKFKVLMSYEQSDFHEKYQALMCRWLSTHVPHPKEWEINVDQEPKSRMRYKADSRIIYHLTFHRL
jgi:hypothetical protein